VLREPTLDQKAEPISSYFHPYARMVSSLVDGRLDACRKAVIIDVHSYPPLPLAYELHPDTPRPELCIGADRFHTDSALLEAVSHAFDGFGEHSVDEPFAGSYVPLAHDGKDHRVSSIMLEIRRDTYTDQISRAPDVGAINDIARRVAILVDTISP
jgi:N-formylglutamate deformylase